MSTSITAMHRGEDSTARIQQTYRYLRILLPLPAVWLLLCIGWVWLTRGELLESISDYYGSPLRDVFVGALMASGICMIAHKGESKLEDYALNFAGVNAFYVALVPNTFQEQLDTAYASGAVRRFAVSAADLLANLKTVVGMFLLITVLFVVLDLLLLKWTRFRWAEQTRAANVLLVASCVAELLLAAVILAMETGVLTLFGLSVFTLIHFSAASILVVNLSFAAASHALPSRLRMPYEIPAATRVQRRRDLGFFGLVTLAMWAGTLVGGVAIASGVRYAVLATEVWNIVFFLGYWAGATRNCWSRGLEGWRPTAAVAAGRR